jgi:hypothetical protein
MSHLIEEYAKSLGVKIGKPYLCEHFYPILDDKYITIHADKKIDSKNYEYFPQVLNLIKLLLNKHGYKVYQIGGPEDPRLDNVDGWFLNLNFKQSAYLIKKSKLHLGIDSLPVHIASMYDVPIVALYSHTYASNAYPFWSSKEKVILLESDKGDNKPSFSYQENPKTIRTIKPEKIAESVFGLLKIEENIDFNTLRIGGHYHVPFIEVVPNFRATLEDQKDKTLYIRADLHNDDQNIAFWCANYKSRLITKNKIPIELIKQFAQNIEHIYFKIKDKTISNDYFDLVKKCKVNFTICIEDEESLSDLRNHYFDFVVHFDNVKERILKIEKYKGYFLTNKILISNGTLYPSEAHLNANKKLDMVNEVMHDDDAFWKDAEHFYIYDFIIRKTTEDTSSKHKERSKELEGSKRTSI